MMNDRNLLRYAKQAAENAYVPYSHFPVGAALECEDGTIFTGCNIENAALGGTICAERVAICKAVSEGHSEFLKLAVWGNSNTYCMPCGACRQFLSEFVKEPDTFDVLCAMADEQRYAVYKLSQLLPHCFELKT